MSQENPLQNKLPQAKGEHTDLEEEDTPTQTKAGNKNKLQAKSSIKHTHYTHTLSHTCTRVEVSFLFVWFFNDTNKYVNRLMKIHFRSKPLINCNKWACGADSIKRFEQAKQTRTLLFEYRTAKRNLPMPLRSNVEIELSLEF